MNTAPTPPPVKTHAPKIAMVSIAIEQVEGIDPMIKVTVHTWAAAEEVCRRICALAPKGGSYLKTDIVVLWADGYRSKVRYDANAKAGTLAKVYEQTWLFHAGLWRPDHIEQDKYDVLVNEDTKRRDESLAKLKTYALVDLGQAPEMTARPAGPSKSEVEAARDMVGKLIIKSEANGGGRALSLELRKALAALARATDMAP